MDDLILDEAKKTTNANAAAQRVKIDAYKWRASKLKPKVYGDKIQNEHSGPDGGPIDMRYAKYDDAALDELIRQKLAAAGL